MSVLSRRALNRALLARQMLLDRAAMPAADAIEHLVGMQAQEPRDPYVALWSRLDGFRAQELSQLFEQRAVVRIALMRSTIHLVTADDCLMLRPLMNPTLQRGSTLSDGVVSAARDVLEKEPRTLTELAVRLAETFPDVDPDTVRMDVRALLPLVQIPPRGLWKTSGRPVVTTAEHWLGRPLDPSPPLRCVVERYLRAFGPASVDDIARWSRLTGLRRLVESMRDRLRTFTDESGRELFDVPDGLLPNEDTPAPPRFLPQYDNALLGFADRSRIMSMRFVDIRLPPGSFKGTFLVDGMVAGVWAIAKDKLTLEPFGTLSKRDAAELGAEADALLAFAGE